MLYYSIIFNVSDTNTACTRRIPRRYTIDEEWRSHLDDVNSLLSSNKLTNSSPHFLIVDASENKASFIVACPPQEDAPEECIKQLRQKLSGLTFHLGTVAEKKEISVGEFYAMGETAASNDLCNFRNWNTDRLGIDYLDESRANYFRLKECLADVKLTRKEAENRAKDIMANDSVFEELGRIYSRENERRFHSHPVHYHLMAGSRASAQEILELLASALYQNKRVLSRRINYIFDFKADCRGFGRCSDYLEDIARQAQGGIVAIEMSMDRLNASGSSSGNYEELVQELKEHFKAYNSKTLFVFVERTDLPGFAKPLLGSIDELVDIINLREGVGCRKEALEYLLRIAAKHDVMPTREEALERLGDGDEFSAGDVQTICNKWYANAMKTHVYKAYKNLERTTVKTGKESNSAYKELKALIGLEQVKRIADQIISTARVQKLRSDMGLKAVKTSLHMIFAGNPGCAKTTVARLLGRILKKEGILKSGAFVEVGRSDLVGKYVGWTAKTVQQKFREANGGILFIDEAYALVDGSNSFGDEAINTIVQEMENHRDDVIVVFAGYPKKMEAFLAKNEGLRSRISFHLDFEDYNAEELTEILELMLKDRGYHADAWAMEKARRIFASACDNEEFGNGRFVRNLLEQAIMRQAQRLVDLGVDHELTKEEVATLTAADFEVTAGKQYLRTKKGPMGFCG